MAKCWECFKKIGFTERKVSFNEFIETFDFIEPPKNMSDGNYLCVNCVKDIKKKYWDESSAYARFCEGDKETGYDPISKRSYKLGEKEFEKSNDPRNWNDLKEGEKRDWILKGFSRVIQRNNKLSFGEVKKLDTMFDKIITDVYGSPTESKKSSKKNG